MKENLTQILMNEAVREGWREWMEKVRKVLPQTDAERPVTWIAAERLARDHGRMVRLVELLREHRPVLSCRVQEEAGLLILVAYHRHGSSADFLLDTAEAYFRERDCGGFLFLCRMQASINAYDEYPHLNVLCNRLAGLLFRRRERLLDAVYLVPLSGGAEQLDMTLRELSRERALPVVLVDCGLTAAGRQRTELLTGGAGAVLVTPQQLTDLYTKKENAQGR